MRDRREFLGGHDERKEPLEDFNEIELVVDLEVDRDESTRFIYRDLYPAMEDRSAGETGEDAWRGKVW